jgi:hypothetical protein
MTAGDTKTLVRAALAAVRDCAETMENQATSLLQALPELSMNEELRPAVLELSGGLKDTSGRVAFELALLQAELSEGKAMVAAVVQRLSNLDSTMMTALDASADIVSQLEVAAEHDEQNEPAFVLVIEAVGVLLQALETAKAATQALQVAVPRAPASGKIPPPPVRVAADGSVVVLQAGAAHRAGECGGHLGVRAGDRRSDRGAVRELRRGARGSVGRETRRLGRELG